jgi:hypothetical protein
VFLVKQLSLQTLHGFRHVLFFCVFWGAMPLLQVQEAEVPVFGKTTQGGESRSEGRKVKAKAKGEGRDEEDGVEGGPQTCAKGKVRARGRRWTITIPRFNVN